MSETSITTPGTSSPGALTPATAPIDAPPAPEVHPAAQFGRAPVEPDLLGSGIVSGPGNQGTANTAHLIGQAGTAGTRLSIPRNLKFGTGTVTP